MLDVQSQGGDLVITIIGCIDVSSGGGSGSGGGSSGWVYHNPDGNTNNGCTRTFGYIDGNGDSQELIEYGVPCLNADPANTNTNTNDPWGNNAGDSNYDTLHHTTGGGGTGVPPSSDTVTNDSELIDGEVVGVLPDRLDLEIVDFFKNLTDDQKDCLNTPFNQLKIQITDFFKANQTIQKFGGDGALIPNEILSFATAAHCTGGDVDFDLEMIVEITETPEFQNQTCLKSIKDDVVKTKQISKIIKRFEPTHPILHLEWGIFNNPEWGNTGQTSLNIEQNTAFINFNSQSLSHVSNIIMVKSIAHELIHAELYRKLKELVDDYNIISLSEYNSLQNNFMGIADYTFRYAKKEIESNGFGGFFVWGLYPDFSLTHHNQMADFYRGPLIDVMKAYDAFKNITRTNADEFYEALSWAGLRTNNLR
jgi:hypothetical protein